MKYQLLLFTLFTAILALAQERGVTPTADPQSEIRNPQSTYAVVVGISDYQSPDIPDLQFAHRDAEAFADWLKSAAGGQVPEANILLLTNQQATFAAFAGALDWLVENCSEGGQGIIYFSGHGDVETKTFNQLGFLLLHDSPARSYKAGAYSLYYLQDIISTLSLHKKARVTVITDACHAGKLAGTSIGGPAATAQNLSRQFANEVKILSCQPDEYSLEGEQWGGGRGVFSWHLIDGLTGLADKNSDNAINLFEIGRYLEDAVPAETAPLSQLPMTVGDRQTVLTHVDEAALAAVRAAKAGRKPSLATTGSKGLEAMVLTETDSSVQRRYVEFNRALENRELLDAIPGHRTADELYLELVQVPELAPLHKLMCRNLAVALQDEVQQALNALLDNDPYEVNNWSFNPQKYGLYPAYLARSIELLGSEHYMANDLRAKQLFFKGYNRAKLVGELEDDPQRRDSIRDEAKALLLQSYALDNEAAYVPFTIGNLYYLKSPPQSDSVVIWFTRALERAPTWLIPYLEISYEIVGSQSDYKTGEYWILRAYEKDSTAYNVLERLAWLRQWQFRPEEANALCDKMIALKPDLFNAYSTKATTLWFMQGAYKDAEKYSLQSLELFPDQYWWAYTILGDAYTKTRRAGMAAAHFRKGLEKSIPAMDKGFLYAGLVNALVQLGQYETAEKSIEQALSGGFGAAPQQTAIWSARGRMWLQRGDLQQAEQTLRQGLTVDPTLNGHWVQIKALLGELKMRQGKPIEAEAWFQKAITQEPLWWDSGFRDEAHLLYGRFLLSENRIAEAEAQFEKCREYRPNGWRQAYGQALLAAKNAKQQEALDWLEQAFERYLPRLEMVLEEPLLKKIRRTSQYKTLVARYFPEYKQ
ncbi:MAG: tetratricopeptide repeat protein [Lewinellaceae bacterium]|nr:tetratricopeptide repeat protein [Saprospiraceae bacterium]MCB9331728.1 tetratricopeptide repeat protein [Lewinellaceae bacterium]